jgi:hypothetical protein
MKNFKDITLSIFAIIGFLTILSSFNNESEFDNRVWTMASSGIDASGRTTMYVLNSATGEVRYFEKEEEQIMKMEKKKN